MGRSFIVFTSNGASIDSVTGGSGKPSGSVHRFVNTYSLPKRDFKFLLN